jgi:hypothetical protein
VDPPHAVGPLVAALRVAVEHIGYIAQSPPPEHGGFSHGAIMAAQLSLAAIEKALRGEK